MQVQETIQTNVAFSSLLRRYMLKEFWALPEPDDRLHYELIKGALHIVRPPKFTHDNITASLSESLTLYLARNNNMGKVFYSRASVCLDYVWGTYFEPDAMQKGESAKSIVLENWTIPVSEVFAK